MMLFFCVLKSGHLLLQFEVLAEQDAAWHANAYDYRDHAAVCQCQCTQAPFHALVGWKFLIDCVGAQVCGKAVRELSPREQRERGREDDRVRAAEGEVGRLQEHLAYCELPLKWPLFNKNSTEKRPFL